MKKTCELLTRFTTATLAVGAVPFMFAYMIKSGGVGCPLCGNQGLHTWEWGGFVGL